MSEDELYDALPAETRAAINRYDFADFVERLRGGGFAQERDGLITIWPRDRLPLSRRVSSRPSRDATLGEVDAAWPLKQVRARAVSGVAACSSERHASSYRHRGPARASGGANGDGAVSTGENWLEQWNKVALCGDCVHG
jgi:hypothetical protein